MDCTAVLMAGGKSSRMGSDKAWLNFQGRPLWQFQVEKLQSFASEVLISAREGALAHVGPEYRIIFDELPNAGPLGGMHRAQTAASFDRVLLLAVDMPKMTSKYLHDLVAEATPSIGIVPECNGYYQGLAAVYPRAIFPLLEKILAGSDHSFQNLIKRALALGLMRTRRVRHNEEFLFENWNAPQDRRQE